MGVMPTTGFRDVDEGELDRAIDELGSEGEEVVSVCPIVFVLGKEFLHSGAFLRGDRKSVV